MDKNKASQSTFVLIALVFGLAIIGYIVNSFK